MQIVGQRGVITQTALFADFPQIQRGVTISRSAFLNINTNYWRCVVAENLCVVTLGSLLADSKLDAL